MFSFTVNLPRIGRRRSKKVSLTEDVVPLSCQSYQLPQTRRSKPRLTVCVPSIREQTRYSRILDLPEHSGFNTLRALDEEAIQCHERLLDDGHVLVVPVSPRQRSRSSRREVYYSSVPERRRITNEYYDDYDGERTPRPTRRLIIERSPRNSRSRSRSTTASTRSTSTAASRISTVPSLVSDTSKSDGDSTPLPTRRVSIGGTTRYPRSISRSTTSIIRSSSSRSSRSMSTASSDRSLKSATSLLSSTPSTSATPSSVAYNSTTCTSYRYKPYEDDNVSIRSYERRIGGGRCKSEKEQRKLKGILKIAEYTSGRRGSYSGSN